MRRYLVACGVLAVGIGLAAAVNGQPREAPDAAGQARELAPVTDAVAPSAASLKVMWKSSGRGGSVKPTERSSRSGRV